MRNEFGEEIEKVKIRKNLYEGDTDIKKTFEEKINKIRNSYSVGSTKISLMKNNIDIGINDMVSDLSSGLITEAGVNFKIAEIIPKIKADYESLVKDQQAEKERISNELQGLLKTDLVSVKNNAIDCFITFDHQRVNHKKEMVSYLSDDILTDIYHNSFTSGPLSASEWYHALMVSGKKEIANKPPSLPLQNINRSSQYLEDGVNSFNSFEEFLNSRNIHRDFNNLNQYTIELHKCENNFFKN